jgi:hypothetical protein
VTLAGGSHGAMRKRPFAGVPTSAAKHGGEIAGQHSQSMLPSRATSAALRPSPISA